MKAQKHLRYAEYITNFLDTKFSLFGVKIGLDPFLNFIPFLGPTIGAGMSAYLLWIAFQFKVPPTVIAKMIFNIVIDYVVSNIPLFGFFGDLVFKSNLRNLQLLTKEMKAEVLVGEVIE